MSKGKYTSKIAQQAEAFVPRESIAAETTNAPEPELGAGPEAEEKSTDSALTDFILSEGGRRKDRGKNSHTFYIRDAHYRKIKDLADRSGFSTSEVINMILDKYL